MRWLYKLENKMGRFCIKNLMRYIIGGMILVFVANMMFIGRFDLTSYLVLSRGALLNLELWRLITFIFIPPNSDWFWIIFSLYFYYMMGTALEQTWGAFRFNVYYLVGILGAIAACFITGYSSNTYLNLSLFLAFATIAPNVEFRLFFMIPIKAKWMAIAYAVFIAVDLVQAFLVSSSAGLIVLVSVAFSLLNYLLFFGPTLINSIKETVRIQRNRRNWRNRNR